MLRLVTTHGVRRGLLGGFVTQLTLVKRTVVTADSGRPYSHEILEREKIEPDSKNLDDVLDEEAVLPHNTRKEREEEHFRKATHGKGWGSVNHTANEVNRDFERGNRLLRKRLKESIDYDINHTVGSTVEDFADDMGPYDRVLPKLSTGVARPKRASILKHDHPKRSLFKHDEDYKDYKEYDKELSRLRGGGDFPKERNKSYVKKRVKGVSRDDLTYLEWHEA